MTARKRFFFEKKNQKTFLQWGLRTTTARRARTATKGTIKSKHMKPTAKTFDWIKLRSSIGIVKADEEVEPPYIKVALAG